MSTISELLSGTYDYLGRPNQDTLSIGLVLPLLLDSIKFYLIDLQITDENYLLTSQVFVPIDRDSLVTATGFSVPVSVEIRDVNSDTETDWQAIPILNATDLALASRDAGKGVAFYGTPTRIRFSFDPIEDWEIEARLWYEPLSREPEAFADSPNMSQAFHSMIKIRAALLCIPLMSKADESPLVTTLSTQLAQWERKWNSWINIDRNAIPIQKRDFRGPRGRGDWGSRNGYWWY